MKNELPSAKNSALLVLNNAISSNTNIAINAFSNQAFEISPYTSDASKTKSAINSIQSSGATALYDAIKLAGDSAVAHKTDGIKSIVILYTDGQDRGSVHSKQNAIDAISKAKASQIDSVFLIFVGDDVDAKNDLESLANLAGRQFLQVSSSSELEAAIKSALGQ
jgi:Mg-chelatase subunit ChlD